MFDVGQFAGVPGVAPFHLPTVTDNLASAFALHNAVQNIPVPFDTLNGSTEQALTQLEAAGFTIDWVRGAVGGRAAPPSSGDLLQVRWTTTLADLTKAAGFSGDTFDDAMQGVLAGVAQSLGLDGHLGLNGNLRITLVMGVDTSGFYVGSESGLSLDVSATGSVGGTGAAGGTNGLSIDGTGAATLTVALGATGGEPGSAPPHLPETRWHSCGRASTAPQPSTWRSPSIRSPPSGTARSRRTPIPTERSTSTRRPRSTQRSRFPDSPVTTVPARSSCMARSRTTPGR